MGSGEGAGEQEENWAKQRRPYHSRDVEVRTYSADLFNSAHGISELTKVSQVFDLVYPI